MENFKEKKEQWYQDKIINWIKQTYPDAYLFKAIGGPYGNRNGTPDIIACIEGSFVAIEVKRPGGKATPLQLSAIDKIKQAGGKAGVAVTVDDAKRIVEGESGDGEQRDAG